MEQDFNRDPYNDQDRERYRNSRALRDPSMELARVSMVIGILSALSYFVMPILLPLSMAPIALMVGIISKGNRDRFKKPAVVGMSFSAVAIAVNLLMFFSIVYVFYKMQTDPAAKMQFDQIAIRLYGMPMDELFERVLAGTLQ